MDDEATEIPSPAHEEEPQETPAPPKRGRGRPPGSKNKVRISVEPPQAREPEEPVVMKARAPRAKKAPGPVVSRATPEPVVSEESPHKTFQAAMSAWQAMAAEHRQARAQHYHNLGDSMFR